MTPGELVERMPRLLRPTAANCGFALFSASNSAIVMGGVFPFLPTAYQTTDDMFLYYLSQSLVFALSVFGIAAITYLKPLFAKKLLKVSAVTYFLGCCCTIGIMYAPGRTVPLLVLSGLLLGLGSSGYHLQWQRVFASQSSDEGTRNLVVGTAFSALVYFGLYLIPIAITQLLIPIMLLPLFTLLLVIETRRIDLSQPMFSDTPLDYIKTYLQATKDYWRSAICIGSIGLASGIVRSMAIVDIDLGASVNASAIIGSFVSSSTLLLLWRRGALRFSVVDLYRIAYPVLVAGFVLLPFFGELYIRTFSVVLYMMYSFSLLLVLLQCAQSSRDRGLNPTIVFGCFAGVVYLMHDIGFVFGYSTEAIQAVGVEPYGAISLIATASIGLATFASFGGFFEGMPSLRRQAERIEFVLLSFESSKRSNCRLGNNDYGRAGDAAIAKKNIRLGAKKINSSEKYADRLAKQCAALQDYYHLTDRETEIMEYLARGRSMRAVAEELVVSENTIRTHAKRIYAKLSVHKRKELQDLIEGFNPVD